MTHDAAQPPPGGRRPLSQETLDRHTDLIQEHRLRQADELLDRLQKARARYKTWSEATPGGQPIQIKLAQEELAAAERELADVEAEYQYARGDHNFRFDEAAAAAAEVRTEAEPAPTLAPGAPRDKGLEPALPWWQQPPYDIYELAQNIGARLESQQKRTSNTSIAKSIESRINEMERGHGRDRRAPNWDTIRGVLTGWKWKPD